MIGADATFRNEVWLLALSAVLEQLELIWARDLCADVARKATLTEPARSMEE